MKKIIFISVIVFCVACVIFYLLANTFGRSLLISKLESTLGDSVKINKLSISFPANIVAKGIELKGLGTIDEVVFCGGVFDLFNPDFMLPVIRINRPNILLKKDLFGSVAFLQLFGKISDQGIKGIAGEHTGLVKAPSQKKETMPKFYIGRLIIRDAKLNFQDKASGDKDILLRVERLNIDMDRLRFSKEGYLISSFKIDGKIPWREGLESGSIKLEGWSDFINKSMQASIKILDIDGVYLYPYYSQWVDLEKARIEKAKLNFTSDINGLNNNLTAECHLELTDIVRRPLAKNEEEENASKITEKVLDIFKATDQGRIALDFTIRTKMTKPEFGVSSIKTAFENKLVKAQGTGIRVEDLLYFPASIVETTIKGTTNITKAAIDGTFAVGNEFKKAIEDTFNKGKNTQK
jgi:hypothetical protein